LLKQFEKHGSYKQVKDGYIKLIENKEGSKILNTIEQIHIFNSPFGDMGARILGLGLLKNTKLLYLELGIFLKE